MSDEAVTMDISDVVAEETPQEPLVSEEVTDAPEEEEEAPEEETPEESPSPEPEEEPVEEAPEESHSPEPEEEPVEEAPEEEAPADSVPIEQVASDIREILAPVESANEVEEVSNSEELTEDLKQRIAELDYLRECCGNWVVLGRTGRCNFLNIWKDRSITVNSNVNYEDTLHQLEKLPEIIKLWAEGKMNTESNHFKQIESYTLNKPLFNDKGVTEKVEVLEKLIDLLINCANGKMRVTQIEEVIDNLY